MIWATEHEEKKAAQAAQESMSYEARHVLFSGSPEASGALAGHKDSIRESQLYKRILGQSLRHVGLEDTSATNWDQTDGNSAADHRSNLLHVVPPSTSSGEDRKIPRAIHGLTGEENERLVRQVTEVAATAAAVAARDAARNRKPPGQQTAGRHAGRALAAQTKPLGDDAEDVGIAIEAAHTGGGHDAPNWSKAKSSIILLGATILYAVIAEILVNTVDVVLESVDIDEKFLGITLFALVPNTTEFLVSSYYF